MQGSERVEEVETEVAAGGTAVHVAVLVSFAVTAALATIVWRMHQAEPLTATLRRFLGWAQSAF